MRICLIFLFIGLCSVIYAGQDDQLKALQDRLNSSNPSDDPIGFMKNVYDTYRTTSKGPAEGVDPQYTVFLENIRREKIEEANICVDCPNLLLLTEQVNSILQHVANDPNSDVPPDTLHEVNSLDGMFFFTKEEESYSHLSADEIPCKRWELTAKNPFDEPDSFDADNHIMVFTKKISFKHISQAQLLEPGKRKIYFFKGASPHDDIVVRVIRDSKGNAEVSYFRDKSFYLNEQKKYERKKIEEKALGPWKERKEREVKEKQKAEETRKQGDHLDVDYGWKTEGDGPIPKKVTVFSIEGKSNGETTSITGGAEVSSRKQAANIKLSDKEGKDYVGLEANIKGEVTIDGRSDFETFAITGQAKQKGASTEAAVQLRNDKNEEVVELRRNAEGLAQLGVPMQFNVYDTGVVVDGKVIAGQDGSYGGTWVLKDRDTNSQYMNLGVSGSKQQTNLGIGHTREVFSGATLGVKLNQSINRDHRDETSAWVQFKMEF